jgi:Zn-dependent protease
MGWEDRPYYRDRGASSSRLAGLLFGSVPLFKFSGIRVRAHASLIVFILCELLLDWSEGFSLEYRLISMGMLFSVILLHEFGHCFAARMVGGTAEDILLWPLGGLAFPDCPRRPLARFWTVAGGPLVNVGICIVAALAIYFFGHAHSIDRLNPFHPVREMQTEWRLPLIFCWWLYVTSFYLLLFNLLPIFPLDGGQMVQTMLWPMMGYHRSMMVSCVVGMCGSVGLAILGIAEINLMLVLLGAWLFYACFQQRMIQREQGPTEPWQADEPDYSRSLSPDPPLKKRRLSRRAVRIARQHAKEEAEERTRLDMILAKVSATGMSSLTWRERRALKKATERRRRNDADVKAMMEK